MHRQSINYSNYSQQRNSSQFEMNPQYVLNIDLIRSSLGYEYNISSSIILSMAREAILHGFMEQEKININGQLCHRFLYQNMIFVLTEGFDAVVTIIWNQQYSQMIGDQYSTFHNNTNQIQQQQQIQQIPPKQPVYVETNPIPLRPAVIQQNQLQQIPQQQFYEECKYDINNNNNNKMNIASCSYQAAPGSNMEGLESLNANSSEYECIIDEIVNSVDNDVDNDPDFADFHVDNDPDLPPLPPPSVCGEGVPSLPPNQTNRLQIQNQSSFYSINTDDNHSEIKYKAQCPPNQRALSSTSSNGNGDGYGIEINISDSLWNELHTRYYPAFSSKFELIGLIQQAIHINRAPISQIGDNKEWCVWIDRYYVYITETDMSTLIDVFQYNQFQNNYGQCLQSLISRNSKKINTANNTKKNNTKLLRNNSTKSTLSNVSSFRGNKLIKNASKRSVISNTSSLNTSRRSVFTETDHNNNNNKKHEYHTIYLKPIIERMKHITNSHKSIDSDYIIDIVDNSIKYGVKRQISKRTFEFKWKSYTIIMSKSLKTILDVTLSNDKNIITVHPDVVSIISKKCPVLDYFTIQKLANKAKLTASFTTKKNDYRQQFIYEYCGCRIVFASNHTTIVEMQCNDTSTNNIKFIKKQTN